MSKDSSVPSSKLIEGRKLAEGKFSSAEVSVVIEKELPIFVNGEHLITASIAPGMEREFVTGYLFGQGFINSVEDISSIELDNNTAKVTLKDATRLSVSPGKANYRIVSGGGRTAYSDKTVLPKIKIRMKIGKKVIFRAMNTLFEKADMYRETEGVHAAGLFTAEAKPVCVVEDIGRHNTLDKVIGYGLMNNIDFGNTFLVSTGRMASEMVTKICRAGIPVVATKTAVTDKGREIGRKCGLTIIGFVCDTGTRIHTDMEVRVVKEAGMKIYTGAERILCK